MAKVNKHREPNRTEFAGQAYETGQKEEQMPAALAVRDQLTALAERMQSAPADEEIQQVVYTLKLKKSERPLTGYFQGIGPKIEFVKDEKTGEIGESDSFIFTERQNREESRVIIQCIGDAGMARALKPYSVGDRLTIQFAGERPVRGNQRVNQYNVAKLRAV